MAVTFPDANPYIVKPYMVGDVFSRGDATFIVTTVRATDGLQSVESFAYDGLFAAGKDPQGKQYEVVPQSFGHAALSERFKIVKAFSPTALQAEVPQTSKSGHLKTKVTWADVLTPGTRLINRLSHKLAVVRSIVPTGNDGGHAYELVWGGQDKGYEYVQVVSTHTVFSSYRPADPEPPAALRDESLNAVMQAARDWERRTAEQEAEANREAAKRETLLAIERADKARAVEQARAAKERHRIERENRKKAADAALATQILSMNTSSRDLEL